MEMNFTFFFSFDLRWFFRTKSLFIFRSRQSENISFVIRSIQKSRKMSKNQMIRNSDSEYPKNWYFWSIVFSTRLLVTWNVEIRSDWLIGRWLNWKIFLLISDSLSLVRYWFLQMVLQSFYIKYYSLILIFFSLIFSFQLEILRVNPR